MNLPLQQAAARVIAWHAMRAHTVPPEPTLPPAPPPGVPGGVPPIGDPVAPPPAPAPPAPPAQ